ncbi:MAG: helix-turn-helix transcriptional regulator [Fimbriimonadaceae bacterium]|nr:helix-turn-helix transcriptional regulator [Fimbriimonadaceae bacterium]
MKLEAKRPGKRAGRPPKAGRLVAVERVAIPFATPADGPVWEGKRAWRSNGGPGRGHPARSRPYLLEIPIHAPDAVVHRFELIGVFAQWSSAEYEAPGIMGATLELVGEGGPVRYELLNGRHYRDAHDLRDLDVSAGDGTSVRKVGECVVESETLRVDAVTFDVPDTFYPHSAKFRDNGSPASFLLFEANVDVLPVPVCPFRGHAGRVSLADVASAVRIGDRVMLARAVDQMETGVREANDLDEARGQCLTFLAMVTAGLLEMGGTRDTHRLLLEAAREFESLQDPALLAERTRELVEEATVNLLQAPDSATDRLIDRALAILERNFAKRLSDEELAAQLGLSTSHFRYLFKAATGKPFHKYLVGLRLERAREMLMTQAMPVSEVAGAVGFTGLAHFSRAFSQRFKVAPSAVRDAAR